MGSKVFFGFWILIIMVLVGISMISQDRSNVMIAQVENNVYTISYQQPVRIKAIHVVPGQQVDSGDVLLEVDQPGLIAEIRRLETERHRLEMNLDQAVGQYFSSLGTAVGQTNQEMERLRNLASDVSNPNLTDQIHDLLEQNRTRNQELLDQLSVDTSALRTQIRAIDDLLDNLTHQTSYLVALAKFDGIIGNVTVNLDELVAPYTNILTLYSGKPTMIKAYYDERRATGDLINSNVLVRCTNRTYSIEGKITDVGNRIIPYPAMLNPSSETQSYGQEIFIKIPENNEFLNGEKVNVYILR